MGLVTKFIVTLRIRLIDLEKGDLPGEQVIAEEIWMDQAKVDIHPNHCSSGLLL